MPGEVLVLFFGSLFGIGGILLGGQWLKYRHLERQHRPEDLARLTEQIDALSDDVRALGDKVLELDERVEFAERMLPGPRGGPGGVSPEGEHPARGR
jgi:hypothetical protein